MIGMRTSILFCSRSLMQYMCAGVGAVTTGSGTSPCAASGRSRAQSAPRLRWILFCALVCHRIVLGLGLSQLLHAIAMRKVWHIHF